MKVLFKKNTDADDNSSDELKEVVPYIDADLDIKNLMPDLITASNEVYSLIGPEIYTKAEEAYAAVTPNEIQKEFLRVVRYPIGVNAYRLYAPTNDLSHTNNGRKMRSDDSEKTPFEWMLDRDNAAQEKRYFLALDNLILFLDRLKTYTVPATPEQTYSNILTALWKTSEAFKSSNALFIRTVAQFDDCFPIQSRILLLKLTPGIKKCENEEIIPRITQAKFDELKTKLKNSTEITDAKDIKLLQLIREACAYYALSWSMLRYSVNLFPEGVLQHYTSDRATTRGLKPALNAEPEAARQAFKLDYEAMLSAIEKELEPEPLPTDITEPIQPSINYGDQFFST